MSILMCNPPWWEGKVSRGLFRTKRWRRGVRAGSRWPFTYISKSKPDKPIKKDYIPYPSFLGYATTYIKNKIGTKEVFFRDSIALADSYKTFFEYIDSIKNKIQYILLESATPSWKHDLKLVEEIKKKHSNLKVIIAGPISTTFNNNNLNNDLFHAAIKGEYEKNLFKVIQGQSGVLNHDLLSLDEMNNSPIPYMDKEISNKYYDGNPIPMNKYLKQAHIWSSRGCPFKCIFCVWPATMTGNDPDGSQKRTVRQYNKEYMKNHIVEWKERFDFESFYFDDDTFNIGNKHTIDMSNLMKEIDIPWFAMCRADTIKKETWKIMADSGCQGVKLGFESGNQFVVDKIVNKHLDLEYGKKIVEYIRSLNMSVHGTFTYGLPGESKNHMIDTKNFINSSQFSTVQESGTAEIEGTPLHTLNTKKLDNYPGAIVDENYDRHIDGNKKWSKIIKNLQHH